MYRVGWRAVKACKAKGRQTSQRALQKQKEHNHVHNTNFFRRHVPTEAKTTANGLTIHSKERMYIVDSGLRYIWWDYLLWTRKEDFSAVKQNPSHWDRQRHCGLRHTSTVSRSLALNFWNIRWQIHRQCYRWEVYATSLVILICCCQENPPGYPKDKRTIECSIENFVPMVAFTKQTAVPYIGSSSANGGLQREKKVKDTICCIR